MRQLRCKYCRSREGYREFQEATTITQEQARRLGLSTEIQTTTTTTTMESRQQSILDFGWVRLFWRHTNRFTNE